MARKIAAWLVLLAVPALLLAAPFHHIHETGHAQDHVAKYHSGSLATHLHFAGRFNKGLSWSSDTEASARSLSLYRADLTDVFVLAVALVSERFVPDDALPLLGWVRDCDSRIHDPPRISSRSPRAPPV